MVLTAGLSVNTALADGGSGSSAECGTDNSVGGNLIDASSPAECSDDDTLAGNLVDGSNGQASEDDVDTITLLQVTGEHYTLTAPHELSDGIDLAPHRDASEIKLTKLGTSGAGSSSHGVLTADNVIVYRDQKNLLVAFEDGGYALLEYIENANSPEAFRYRIDIGSNQTISPDGLGGYNVVNKTGEHVVSLGAPWAIDAEGVDVPTRYTLQNGVLTLEVDHRAEGMKYAYPIVADPCLSWKCVKKVVVATVIGAGAGAAGGAVTGAVAGCLSTGPACPGGASVGVIAGAAGGAVAGGLGAGLTTLFLQDDDRDDDDRRHRHRHCHRSRCHTHSHSH